MQKINQKLLFNLKKYANPFICHISHYAYLSPSHVLTLVRADEMNMSSRLKRIALGQGQGKKAVSLIEKGITAGDW